MLPIKTFLDTLLQVVLLVIFKLCSTPMKTDMIAHRLNLISQTIGVHEITEYLCPKLKLFPWYNNVAIGSEYMI